MKSDLALADADSFASDTLARINASLGSDIVVFGSYAMVGGTIRFDVRLQDTEAGDTIASVAETGGESELFEIVSRIGSRLRERLGVTALSPEQVASVQASLPSNPGAARLYAEGLPSCVSTMRRPRARCSSRRSPPTRSSPSHTLPSRSRGPRLATTSGPGSPRNRHTSCPRTLPAKIACGSRAATTMR